MPSRTPQIIPRNPWTGDRWPFDPFAFAGWDITANVFANVKGRKFGAWVDADSRNNGYNSGDLIQQPAYILESILRDVLGLTSTTIDYASFDTAGNTTDGKRDNWLFDRSVYRQQSSLALCDSLMQESVCAYIRDSNNKEKIVALDDHTPALSLDSGDVLNESGRPIVSVSQVHTSKIFNEFFLNYRFNYGSRAYDKQLFVTASDNNLTSNTRSDKSPLDTYEGLCSTSQTYYNVTRRWSFDSDWIRDDATAELFIKIMADWLAFRKWIVEVRMPFNTRTLSLEVMDQVKWNLSLLPVSMRDVKVSGLTATGSITGGTLAADDYYYVITATDKYGETQASVQKTGTVASGTTGSVALTWTALDGAAGYRIYRSTTSGDFTSKSFYTISSGATTSYTDTGAAASGTGTAPANAVGFFVTNLIYYPRQAQIQARFLAVPLISRTGLAGYGEEPYGKQYGYTGW